MKGAVVVLGAGGHSRVVVAVLNEMGFFEILRLDDDAGVAGIAGPITDRMLRRLASTGTENFIVGMGSVNAESCAVRDKLFMLALSTSLKPLSAISLTSIAWGDELGPGVFIGPRAIVMPGAIVRSNSIINTGAIVEHDCQVGWSSHIATGAMLCGGVKVGRLVHVGAGAIIKQGIWIGDGATIGMGAVVLEDVGPGLTVVGNPARVLERCSPPA